MGITIDKLAPSAPALHMVLVLGFLLQALSFTLIKVSHSHAANERVFFFALTAAIKATLDVF
jgi:hypothetical protein